MQQVKDSKTFTTGIAVVINLGINGLATVRSFIGTGIKVFGLYSNTNEIGRHSRHCKAIKFHKSSGGDNNLLDTLTGLAKSFPRKAVLFPTNDFSVDFISKNSQILLAYYRFIQPDRMLLESLINKESVNKIVQHYNIKVPRTHNLSGLDDIERYATENISYPCIIKPDQSFGPIVFPFKTKVINTPEALIGMIRQNPSWAKFIVIQEIIPGDDSNVYQCTSLLSNESKVIQSVTMQKIRQYPPGFGVTSYGKCLDVAELKSRTKYFLEQIGYKGVASLEFKWDARREQFYFIELNPRLPYYNSLFLGCGINFPLTIFEYLNTGSIEGGCNAQKDEINWVNFRYDLSTFLHNLKCNKISLSAWLRQLLEVKTYAVWAWGDKKPFLSSIKANALDIINHFYKSS
jgi:D-aspartate ligase